jgi:hypothetical protein
MSCGKLSRALITEVEGGLTIQLMRLHGCCMMCAAWGLTYSAVSRVVVGCTLIVG